MQQCTIKHRKPVDMKTATIPSLRVDPALREAAESVLDQGETLSAFVETAIRDGIDLRRTQREFIARELASYTAASQSNIRHSVAERRCRTIRCSANC